MNILELLKILLKTNDYFAEHISSVLYSAAESMLKYFTEECDFRIFNNASNTESDVRELLERQIDNYIDRVYVDASDVSLSWLETYNIITTPKFNKAIKKDIFNLVRFNTSEKD